MGIWMERALRLRRRKIACCGLASPPTITRVGFLQGVRRLLGKASASLSLARFLPSIPQDVRNGATSAYITRHLLLVKN